MGGSSSKGSTKSKVWDGGHIYIELLNETSTFVAGSQIVGNVHMDLHKPTFMTNKLTIGIHGREKTFCRKKYYRQVERTRTVRDNNGSTRTEKYMATESYYVNHNGH